VCTTRIVLNLEKMVVKEAQRAFTYLSLYDYLTDLIVVNRVLPPEVTDTYFDSWRESQQRYSTMVDTAFSPIPTLRTKLFDHEIVGLDSLAEMADSIYADQDPSQIFYHSIPQRIRKVGNNYELQIHLPFVGKEEVDIKHREGDLFITVGPYKREISLPRVLNGKRVSRGRLEEGMLSVTFSEAKP
jgi:arsenite-transporting ATPase